MGKLTGKTALVTGASGGIGRAIAERLAADGALVAVHYGRNEAAASKTAAAINQAGGRAFTVGADLGVAGDVDTLFAGLQAGLAGRPLDILVNNAGGALGTGSIEETTPEEFDRVIALICARRSSSSSEPCPYSATADASSTSPPPTHASPSAENSPTPWPRAPSTC